MKTRIELEEENGRLKCKSEERLISNTLYADKKEFSLIQKINFVVIGTIAMAFLTLIIIKIGWKN